MLCYVYLADVTERQDDDGRECRIVEQQRDKQHSHEDRQDCGTSSPDPQHYSRSLYGVLTAYIMLLIAVYYTGDVHGGTCGIVHRDQLIIC